MGQLAQSILRLTFDPLSHDAATAGVQLELHNGRRIHIWLSIRIVLADEAALHSLFCYKGAGGLKCCMLCTNVYNFRYVANREALLRIGGVDHTCSDVGELHLMTDATIRSIMARLSAARPIMTDARYEDLTKKLGWRLSALILDEVLSSKLSPTSVVMFDWMHVLFVRGVWNYHMGCLLVALRPLGVTASMFDAYVQAWRWPAHVGTLTGKDVFSEQRIKSCYTNQVLTCQASESLSLFPVIGNYAENGLMLNASAVIKDHARCLLHLVRVVGLIVYASRYTVAPDRMQADIKTYLESFKAIYGPENMQPKFHQLLHMPSFLHKHGVLPNCFVLERKHRAVKRFANQIQNTSRDYSTSVLREVTCRHIAKLQLPTARHFESDPCLIEPKTPSARVRDMLQAEFGNGNVMVSRTARFNKWEKVSQGDLVMYQLGTSYGIGRVVLLASIADDDESAVIFMIAGATILRVRDKDITIRLSGRNFMAVADDLLHTLTWRAHGDIIVALKPWSQLR